MSLSWLVIAALVTTGSTFQASAREPSPAPHEAARHVSLSTAVVRTAVAYSVPPITLVRDDGKKVWLPDEIGDGRPVVLNFIYTSCSSTCPLASYVFSELQRMLGKDRDRIHLVSISIDPQEDTPVRLRDYARRFEAGPSWQHYTGTVSASLVAQRAFGAYRGDKTGHLPVTFVRTAPGEPWVRLDGFATADTLLREIRGHGDLTASASPQGQDTSEARHVR